MKLKSLVLLAVALGCGLVAMLGVQQVLSGDRHNAPREETVQVLVATADIAPGVPLDKTNTIFKTLPRSVVPTGAVTNSEEIEERSLTSRAVPGETIMLAKLGEKGVFGASSEIPEGMRVVTVSVNQTKTHSGLIRPGDRVDVLVTYKIRRGSAGMISRTKTVLEYIKVFAADSMRAGSVADSGDIHNVRNISVLVDPEQANLLMLAESKGQLHLALRHKSDNTSVKTGVIDETVFDDVEAAFGHDDADGGLRETADRPSAESETAATAPPAPEKPTWKIRIYNGPEARIVEVDLPDDEPQGTPSVRPPRGPDDRPADEVKPELIFGV